MREPPSVDAFGGGGFRVGGLRIEGGLLILDDQPGPWPAGPALADLVPQDFAAVLGAPREAVEFVLLGTGAAVAPAPRAVREALARETLGLEVMSTPEACRLYNVLARDGRRIAAAFLPV